MSGENGKLAYRKLGKELYEEHTKLPDFTKLYERACSELDLQQEKRDYIVKIYMLIMTFLIPLLVSLDNISIEHKGYILLVASFIGVMLTVIVVRYRVYKEAYWIACVVIMQLHHFKEEAVTKENIQALYYNCMLKKWKKNINIKNGVRSFSNWRVFKNNIFSAETLYYCIIALLTSISVGVGTGMVFWGEVWLGYIAGGVMIILLMMLYFKHLKRFFQVLVDDNLEESFNYAFSKAWILHFYRS